MSPSPRRDSTGLPDHGRTTPSSPSKDGLGGRGTLENPSIHTETCLPLGLESSLPHGEPILLWTSSLR